MRRAALGCFLAVFAAAPGGAAARAAAGFRWRGVLEGFYGRPWSWEERRAYMPWLAARGFNLFVLAPKDDELLRRRWRDPLPEEYLRELRRLSRAAAANAVALAWTLSPGLDLKPGDPADLDAAARKYESALAAGATRLVIAFDDTEPRAEQVDFANAVLARLRAARRDLDMTFVPAQYWSAAAPSPYLDAVAARLDPAFRVAFTGPQILSRRIDAEDARRLREYLRHALVLGDNYPVQDRLVESGRLFLGPLVGREAGLSADVEVWVANATPLPEAAKIPLATVADFASNPRGYDPARAWRRALTEAGGPAAAALTLLARECSASWISESAPGGLAAALGDYASGRDREGLARRLREAAEVPGALAALPSTDLRRELDPWARKLAAEARAALEALRPRPDPARLEALRRRAEGQSAVVSDLALERFLDAAESEGGAARLREEDVLPTRSLIGAYCDAPGPASAALLRRRLERLASSAALLRGVGREGPAADARELDPWPRVLALSAAGVLEELEPRSWGPRLGGPWRWLAGRGLARASFLPLLASRRRMDELFDDLEAGWARAERPRRSAPVLLGVWLSIHGWLHPASIASRLDRELRAYRAGGDPRGLELVFTQLRDLPQALPRPLRARLPAESEPWLDKVAGYGAAGLKALELQERYAGAPPATELASWRKRREDLRSGNGLELALELKLDLDSFARWLRAAPERRTRRPDRTLPADPGEIL